MKFLKYFIPFFAFMATVGCNDEQSLKPTHQVQSGDKITIDLSLDMAEITSTKTRAFADNPDYANLKLYVVEFELRDANQPYDNNLSKNYTAFIEDEGVSADDHDVHYKITLNKTDQPRVLHFIAVPSSTELDLSFGSEASMISSLQVDNSTPAYWNRIEFPNGYGSYDQNENWTNIDGLEKMFEHVPMLCNFAKISLSVDASAGFTLDGYALINRPAKGTVAPWISKKNESGKDESRFPQFLDGKDLKPYSTISADYKGYWPFNDVTDVADKTPTDDLFTNQSKYLYEHPHTDLNSPLILIRGHKADGNTMYYKLDLGKTDDDNLFQFYNILRNFEYQVTITEIGADGYSTAQAALNGVVYNNFSFDVNTRRMLNVSDGDNMLWVNQTTFVVTNTDETTIHFLYRYKENIGNNGGNVVNDNIEFKNLDTGEAITGITYSTTDDADGWREVTITTVEPEATRKSQEFIIYDKETGLGRTIRVIVRIPWNYNEPSLYGVNYDTYSEYQDAVKNYSQWKNTVSSMTATGATIGGEPLTIGFVIGNDVDEAMFPLDFVFEANPQNIENNKLGNLLVQTGTSLFPTVTTTRIKYVKTVTWLDWNTELSEENPTGAQVTLKDDSGNEEIIHFVRGRFLTMSSITGSTNNIRVYNPYIRVRNDDGTYNPYLEFTFGVNSQAHGPNLAKN